MKRDPDIIRAILLQVEKLAPGHLLEPDKINVESADKDTVAEHIRLLKEVNYIEADLLIGSNLLGVEKVIDFKIYRLTK